MSKTVRQIIKELKKEDPNAIVLTADHDHFHGEWNGYVGLVHAFDHELVEEEMFKLDKNKEYVVIRV